MGTRGRKSATEQTTATIFSLPQRPAPPKDLTAAQAAVWKRVVDSRAADYFPAETHALLRQYCRAVTAAETVARLVDEADAADIDHYDKLLRMAERQSKQMTALARSMRLTHQARYRADSTKARPHDGGVRPWEG